MEYYPLFERLTSLMASLDEFDIPAIFSTLADLCKLLHVSKGVTTFYESPEKEQQGEGEPFVCYDSGEEHRLVSHLRFTTPAGNIVVCDVFQAEGAAPFTEQERYRVNIIQRMMLTYLNRTRMGKIVERLKYWDDDGYTNLHYYYARIMKLKAAGALPGKTAARINLKHFSLVNEQVGKEMGDFVMRRYIDTLHAAMGEGAVLSRLGGDNFVLLFETEKLPGVREVFAGVPVPVGEHQRIEVSSVAGLYTITDASDIANPGDVMERITSAFLAAKRENTEDTVFYTEELEQAKEHAKRVHHRFNQGLLDGEFVPYYQPKVDIKTNCIVGAEALCRWLSEGRIIPPIEFVPELEQGQDICRLDFYMLERVCRDIRRWLDEGKPVVTISVNLSRRHLIDPDLFSHIVEIIDRNEIPHYLIEIELTETTTDVEFKDLKNLVGNLQKVGISTSVDDFGIGYSSLNLIKQIPWDVLKLDKSIIPANGEDIERGTHLFQHVIAMAREIGLKCIAEGVETEAQLEIMREYGCRYVQGYVFDKPLPVAEFENRLKIGAYSCV